ncbi:unnamed protein product [Ectocarpus sp. CCAP 1310/34]|nr:unnamed protein product [Ectocarpus sp. CCAP 1310/34]
MRCCSLSPNMLPQLPWSRPPHPRAWLEGSHGDYEDIAELLAGLRIEPGKRIEEEPVNAIQGWATIEDDDEVVEAIRLDMVDDMTAQLNGVHVSAGREEVDEQEEDRGDEDTGRVRRAPPAYGELSSYFGVLEAAQRRVATEKWLSI